VSQSSLHRQIHKALLKSSLYREFEKAFTDATGMPLRLQYVGAWDLAHHGNANENPFCKLIANAGPACAACLEMQAKLENKGKAVSELCPAGLCDSVVPVRAGGETVAYLHTGQVFLETPTEARFAKAVRKFRQWKIELDTLDFREAFFGSTVLSPIRHNAQIKLLTIFATQLSDAASQILLAADTEEPASIQKAKLWISENFAEDCSLESMASFVNMNTFTFSRQFSRVTGLPFTKYLARTRVAEAQKKLNSAELRINEVALAVGFRSLPHFNRVFRQVTGISPTAYRRSTLGKFSMPKKLPVAVR